MKKQVAPACHELTYHNITGDESKLSQTHGQQGNDISYSQFKPFKQTKSILPRNIQYYVNKRKVQKKKSGSKVDSK